MNVLFVETQDLLGIGDRSFPDDALMCLPHGFGQLGEHSLHAGQDHGKRWTKVLLYQYGFAHRWLGFCFATKL
jgi:hypothetical protein